MDFRNGFTRVCYNSNYVSSWLYTQIGVHSIVYTNFLSATVLSLPSLSTLSVLTTYIIILTVGVLERRLHQGCKGQNKGILNLSWRKEMVHWRQGMFTQLHVVCGHFNPHLCLHVYSSLLWTLFSTSCWINIECLSPPSLLSFLI